MKMMDLTGVEGGTVWINPMKVESFVRGEHSSTRLVTDCPSDDGEQYSMFYLKESPEEVARRFEEATR